MRIYAIAIIAALSIILSAQTARGERRECRVVDSVLVVPAGVTEIAEREFTERPDIREIRFEGNVLRKIGRSAFAWCPNLRILHLPEGLDDIGSLAFAYCSGLEEASFPASLAHIGANAFAFCTSLREATLPPRLKELESYAFCECSRLERVVLPANANMLGEMLFAGCLGLREIVEPSPTPPPFECNSQPFDPDEFFLYPKVNLLVPPKSIEKYRSSQGWSLFPLIKGFSSP